MQTNKKAFPVFLICLICITAAQLCWTVFVFACEKDGHHSDEVWSYGLANSSGQPFVFARAGVSIDDIGSGDIVNIGCLTDGKVLNDYITVQQDERFGFGAVWENQILDHHPPLYYLLLHAVCSLFPDRYSPVYGFVLNCVFLAVTQVFLFLAARLIVGDGRAALICCLFYGGGHAALYTFTFIRQYALLTMLAVMLVYFTARLHYSGSMRRLPPVLAVSFAMFMTHYYGIVFAGALAACVCLHLLIKRRTAAMLVYGFSFAGSLGLFFAVYPSALRQMADYSAHSSTGGAAEQLRAAADLITEGLFGFGAKGGIGAAAAVLIGSAAVSAAVYLYIRGRKSGGADLFPSFPVIASAAVCAVMLCKTDLGAMGSTAVRYLFCTFPMLCMAAVKLVYPLMISAAGRRAAAFTLAAAAAAVLGANLFGENRFAFRQYPDGIDAAELAASRSVAVIVEEEWELTCLADVLRDAGSVFVTTYDRLDSDLAAFAESGIKPELIIAERIALTGSGRERLAEWGMTDLPPDDPTAQPALEKLLSGRDCELSGIIDVTNGKAGVYTVDSEQ